MSAGGQSTPAGRVARRTAPPSVAPPPPRRQLRDVARNLWREYTRMRTAIAFLIALVLLVLVGSFVPQQDTSQQLKVDEFLQNHRNLNDLGSHLGLPLTEVFVSPLLYVVLGSLYLALAACVIRRGRALAVRTLRGYPRTPQYWGECGSWLFHTSFFLLLVAVVWGKATGFDGLMTVTEGQRVTEARASYATLREGMFFGGHADFQVQLDRFAVTYQPNGQALDYVSSLSVYRDGRRVASKDVRVNDFLGYDDVEFYQQDYGWAPWITVRNPRGEVVYDSPVQFFDGGAGTKSAQVGVLKVPGFDYTIPGAKQPLQIGARMAVFPDARASAHVNADGSVSSTQTDYSPGGFVARNPVLMLQLFVGDLGLGSGRPQNVNELDISRMQPYFSDGASLPVPLGQTIQLPLAGTDCAKPQASGCFQVTFTRLPQYSLFQVKRDTGVPYIYASFALVMVGLMTKLYLRPLLERRRRRARSAPPGGRRARGERGRGDREGDDAGGAPSDHEEDAGYAAWVGSAGSSAEPAAAAARSSPSRRRTSASISSGGT